MKKSINLHCGLASSLAGTAIVLLTSAAPAEAAKIPNGSITTKQLANKSVTTSKLANISITTPKLANGCVTLSKLDPTIGVWSANSANVFFNGDVGIGTSTPTTKLDVAGTISATALRSPGAGVNSGTFAFIQKATVANIGGGSNHITFIDNAICNGDPNAILIVTHNWSQDSSVNRYHTQPIGVYYQSPKWSIYHQDNTTAMEAGDAFNVMIIKP